MEGETTITKQLLIVDVSLFVFASFTVLAFIIYSVISFTGSYSPGWTFGLPLRGFLITHTYRYTVGLLWTSDQPDAEASTYTGQHNI
jgi:hypothetical protein